MAGAGSILAGGALLGAVTVGSCGATAMEPSEPLKKPVKTCSDPSTTITTLAAMRRKRA